MPKSAINCAVSYYILLLKLFSALSPVMLLVARLVIAKVFLSSGLVKIEDFGSTVALFRDEYKTPFLPPEIAAFSATFFELACSCLLAIGLASRLATLPLLGMTAVIQFTYDQNVQHLFWAVILGMILTQGAGRLSADYFIGNYQKEKNHGQTQLS